MTSIMLLTIGCNANDKEMVERKVYLTNHSIEEHDSVYYKIFIDGEPVIEAPYKNQYLSYHWDDFTIKAPTDTFQLRISVSGLNYQIEKDTTIKFEGDESLFIRYYFTPSPDKYMNPEIYRRWDGKTDLNTFADSLYSHNLLDKSYLLNTIPSEEHIFINTAIVKGLTK